MRRNSAVQSLQRELPGRRMDSDSFRTAELQDLVSRIRTGDKAASDQLIRRTANQLEILASRMLQKFPKVSRWEQTGDILQNALQRLLKTLEKVQPKSVDVFFSLSAQAIRWELLDMARHYRGPTSYAANHDSMPDGGSNAFPPNFFGDDDGMKNLDRWTAFHEAIGQLPDEYRNLLELGFYQGLSKSEISRVLGVEERTIRRRWNRAAIRLAEVLGDEVPV